MGSRLSRLSRWFALLFSLVAALALALSGAALPRAQAQDVEGGAVDIKFSPDTLPIGEGVLCQGFQYKLLVKAVQVIGTVRKQIRAGIELDAALNPIAPRYIDVLENGGEGVVVYDAQNVGQEHIAYTAYQKTVLSPDAGSQPQPEIAQGSLSFSVKECLYTVTLAYTFTFPLGTVFGLTDDVPLTKNKAGTLEGDDPFEFQQIVDVSPCVASFSAVTSPTHITGTVDKAKHELTLNFKYADAKTSITATCPIAGTSSASHTINPASLGVTAVTFPEEGGARAFPASLGGKFTIIVNRTIK